MDDAKVEQVAEAVHNAWCKESRKEGFHHPKDCPSPLIIRCPGCHQDMIPVEDKMHHTLSGSYCDECYTEINKTKGIAAMVLSDGEQPQEEAVEAVDYVQERKPPRNEHVSEKASAWEKKEWVRIYTTILADLARDGVKAQFDFPGHRTTTCLLTYPDGWEVIGKSHTKDPQNFDPFIGAYWALRDAIDA